MCEVLKDEPELTKRRSPENDDNKIEREREKRMRALGNSCDKTQI